jgi:hypothetical protein
MMDVCEQIGIDTDAGRGWERITRRRMQVYWSSHDSRSTCSPYALRRYDYPHVHEYTVEEWATYLKTDSRFRLVAMCNDRL